MKGDGEAILFGVVAALIVSLVVGAFVWAADQDQKIERAYINCLKDDGTYVRVYETGDYKCFVVEKELK